MNCNEIISNYYEMAETREKNGGLIRFWKPKSMRPLPENFSVLYSQMLTPNDTTKHGSRFYLGNPDFYWWDAIVMKKYHGKTIDVFVCSILVRPFSDSDEDMYTSLFTNRKRPSDWLLTMWDSRTK